MCFGALLLLTAEDDEVPVESLQLSFHTAHDCELHGMVLAASIVALQGVCVNKGAYWLIYLVALEALSLDFVCELLHVSGTLLQIF